MGSRHWLLSFARMPRSEERGMNGEESPPKLQRRRANGFGTPPKGFGRRVGEFRVLSGCPARERGELHCDD